MHTWIIKWQLICNFVQGGEQFSYDFLYIYNRYTYTNLSFQLAYFSLC